MDLARNAALLFLLLGAAPGLPGAPANSPSPRAQPRMLAHSGFNQTTKMVDAVIIDDGPLVHTAQILPWGSDGKIVGQGDISRQTQQVFDNLTLATGLAGSLPGGFVKINIYVAQSALLPEVRATLSSRVPLINQVALSFVTGNLPDPDALVAMDAVAVPSHDPENHSVQRVRARAWPFLKGTTAAVLPGGGRYYISGQAKNGALPDAARDTLASLQKTLAFLGLDKSNVVQLKAFMQPISAAASVQAEITQFFAPDLPPPVVFVEWHSPTNTPIEIELLAADNQPQVKTGDTVDFLTPPDLTVSKVFSRVAHVNYGRTVYFSGLYGDATAPAAKQLHDIYVYLDYLLPRVGTDFDHLVKATYYVTDQDGSDQLNAIRPKFYNPQRPPAASKATVNGVGLADRSVTIDMIGVAR